MEKFKFSSLTLKDLKRSVQLKEGPILDDIWNKLAQIELSDIEQQQSHAIAQRLLHRATNLMNEATIWAKAIFPLLTLAETATIEAWAEVSLFGRYRLFELEGIADGVLATSVAGRIESPYLIIVETKKGVEGENPVFQLYGQLLAAAYQNWDNNNLETQVLFGCYTIGDSWQFLRAEVTNIDSERPTLKVDYSREYVEKLEVEMILKILKGIVAAMSVSCVTSPQN
jgi:hypothetical protein